MAHLLVVDDSPEERRIVQALLVSGGHDARSCGSGQDALKLLRHSPVEIVLTDLHMPGMDGLELVQELGQLHPGIPTLLMTAFGSEASAREALEAGAAGYIPKAHLEECLNPTVDHVAEKLAARRDTRRVLGQLESVDARFVLGNELSLVPPLVANIEATVARLLGREHDPQLFQLGTALGEAISNAIHHGNLGLDSSLREGDGRRYAQLASERAARPPWSERRVHVRLLVRPPELELTIRDEGEGFDPTGIPDPTAPENLLRAHGRGIYLMHTFMDGVRFNATGNEVTLVRSFNDTKAHHATGTG